MAPDNARRSVLNQSAQAPAVLSRDSEGLPVLGQLCSVPMALAQQW